MYEAREAYSDALKARRAGDASLLDGSSLFVDVKPDFYADARILSEDALRVFDDLQNTHPPYGLVSRGGSAVTRVQDGPLKPWLQLTIALKATGHYVVEQAKPSTTGCPYHTVLSHTLGVTRPPLLPFDHDTQGIDTLRNVVAPGAELNAVLFTSLIRRLPALQRLHGSTAGTEHFARNSVSLLREPLAHPQQRAAAFVLSLGGMAELLTDQFLNDNLAQTYTKIEARPDGQERLAWAIPTEEFTTRWEVRVPNRTQGSETDLDGGHVTTYPPGTKLRDIAVHEPTIGCPGDQLARAMWNRVIDVAVAENLWDSSGSPANT